MRRTHALVATLGLVLTSVFVLEAPAHASVNPNGTNNAYYFPSGSHYNYDFLIYPTTQANSYFWSMQFAWDAPGSPAQGQKGANQRDGYMGLQQDSSGKKVALATIFGCNTSSGSTCIPGSTYLTGTRQGTDANALPYKGPVTNGEGGYTLRVAFNWQPNHYYRVRMWNGGGPTTWNFYVSEVTSGLSQVVGTETSMGYITTPESTVSNIHPDVGMFTEYFGGQKAACTDFPRSDAFFSARADGLSLAPTSSSTSISGGNCLAYSYVQPSSSWMEHLMGGFALAGANAETRVTNPPHYNEDLFFWGPNIGAGYEYTSVFSFTGAANRQGELTIGKAAARVAIYGADVTGSGGALTTRFNTPTAYTITRSYSFLNSHYYRLRIWNTGVNTWGFWLAEVTYPQNTVVGTEISLGSMTAPNTAGLYPIATSIASYGGGSLSSCAAFPASDVYMQTRYDSGTYIRTNSDGISFGPGSSSCTGRDSASWYAEWAHLKVT